jgi:hypothetical protein
MENPKDPQLWEMAQRRVGFRVHLITYIVMNIFFWVLWFINGNGGKEYHGPFPWPVWAMGGWGIGLLFHFLGVYVFSKQNLVEKEYEKLAQQRKEI